MGSTLTNLSFTKMHGLGNDFVMLSHRDLPAGFLDDREQLSALATTLCDRHFGIGADGLIIAAPASTNTTDDDPYDIRFVYLNSDGSWAEMCGNGIRCFARYVLAHQLVPGIGLGQPMRVETLAGLIQPIVNADNTVTVDMGRPRLTPESIPATGFTWASQIVQQNLPVTVHDTTHPIPVTLVNMGNPHVVIFQDDLLAPLDPAQWGPIIETHAQLPQKANVEFVKVLSADAEGRRHLEVAVWERGCGFTLACGTGACAVGVASHLAGKAGLESVVHLPGGPLNIRWDKGPSDRVWMTGPAEFVFTGSVDAASLQANQSPVGTLTPA
jgi:diaminopimelate epimerase